MKFSVPYLLCFCLLTAAAGPVRAQRIDTQARVYMKNHSGSIDVILVERRGSTLYARMGESQAGSIAIEAPDVTRLEFALPADLLYQAEAYAQAGRTADAVKRLRPVVRPLLAYLDLPGNAAPAVLALGRYARTGKLWAEAINLYRALEQNPEDAVHQEALGWLAYCSVKNHQPEEARTFMELYHPEDPRDPGFGPRILAEALLLASEERDEAALDLAARASALLRIDHELYPESLLVCGESYRRMAGHATGASSAHEVVLGKANELPPPSPPMSPEEFMTVSSNVMTRLIQLFPSSAPAAEARELLDAWAGETAAANPEPVQPVPGETP